MSDVISPVAGKLPFSRCLFFLISHSAIAIALISALPATAASLSEQMLDNAATHFKDSSSDSSLTANPTTLTAPVQSVLPSFVADELIKPVGLTADNSVAERVAQQMKNQPVQVARVTSVAGLSDVRPTDWAFQALQSLVERYGVIAGYPDGTFRGNRAMTRYEFAAGLNAAMDRINEIIQTGQVPRQDLETLQKLQKEFEKELVTLRGRVDTLEGRVQRLELFQFSTTTRLTGQTIFAVNGGFQTNNRIPNPGGDVDPNTVFLSRTLLNFNTSFSGQDNLLIQLQVSTSSPSQRTSGSPGVAVDAAGFLADDASSLFYAVNRLGNGFQLNRLSYTFPLSPDITLSVFPRGYASDYVDNLRFANKQFDNATNFSTFALTQNILLFAQDFVASGAAASWRPGQGPLTLRAVYAAQDATVPNPTGLTTLPTGLGSITDAYGNPGGDRRGGLFGDPNLGIFEAEYAPTPTFAFRAQYARGSVGGRAYSAVGANFEWRFMEQGTVFGRFGYAPDFFPPRFFGGEKPFYWQAGLAFTDLLKTSDILGVSVGQPLIIGRSFAQPNISGVQTNYELFYNYPLSANIRITPLLQVITDPLNNDDRGAIFTGTLRTVFSF